MIKDSSAKESTVTLLKAEPLSVAEVNEYGEGHIYSCPTSSTCGSSAQNIHGYGGIPYYSSSTCTKATDTYTGCTTNYAQSEIKYAVDAWKNAKAQAAEEARLITRDEYIALTVAETYETPTEPGTRYVPQYDWLYNNNYSYWTISPYNDSTSDVWIVDYNGSLYNVDGDSGKHVVRPVIVLSKSLLSNE